MKISIHEVNRRRRLSPYQSRSGTSDRASYSCSVCDREIATVERCLRFDLISTSVSCHSGYAEANGDARTSLLMLLASFS